MKLRGRWGEDGLRWWKAQEWWKDLWTILPNESYAALLRRESCLGARQLSSVGKGQDGEYPQWAGLHDPLTKGELSWLRYGRSYPGWDVHGATGLTWSGGDEFAERISRALGPRIGMGFSLYYILCKDEVRDKLRTISERCRLLDFQSAGAWHDAVKAIGTAAKKGNLLFGDEWDALVNLETIGGFVKQVDPALLVDDIKAWVSEKKEHQTLVMGEDGHWVWSEEQFIADYKNGVKKFLSLAPNAESANRKAQTVKQWASDPGSWATAGASSTRVTLEYEPDGKTLKKKVGKTKWQAAAATAPSVIEDTILRPARSRLFQRIKAVLKLQNDKPRLVAGADDESYVRQAYVSHWIEAALRNHPESTLFFDLEQHVELKVDMAVGSVEGVTTKAPLDFSAFDHQINQPMLAANAEAEAEYVAENATTEHGIRDQLIDTINIELQALLDERSSVSIRLADGSIISIAIKNGVLSGWQWTARWDTEANYGIIEAAIALCLRVGLKVNIISRNHQGDDVRLILADWESVCALVWALRVLGFDVNDNKVFTSDSLDEYLRQIGLGGVARGYPARAISALLWRNPLTKDPPKGLFRIGEQVNSWSTAFSRDAFDRGRVFKHMLDDICNSNNITRHQAWRVLNTPATVGGIGLFEEEVDWLGVEPGRVESTARLVPMGLRGLNSVVSEWAKVGVPFTTEQVAEGIQGNVKMEDGSVEVLAGALKPIQKSLYPTLMWPSQLWKNSLFPTVAKKSDALPETLSDVALGRAINEKRWDWIRDVYLDATVRSSWDKLLTHSTRWVQIAWLKGELPFSVPVVFGHDPKLVSLIHTRLVNFYWSIMMLERSSQNRQVSRETAIRIGISAERECRNRVLAFEPRLGA